MRRGASHDSGKRWFSDDAFASKLAPTGGMSRVTLRITRLQRAAGVSKRLHNSSPPIQSLCHTVCLITVRPLHRRLRLARFWCLAWSGGQYHSRWRMTLTGWHKSCAAQLPFRLAGGTPCRFILPCTMSRITATNARSNWVLRSFACARPPTAAPACCRIH